MAELSKEHIVQFLMKRNILVTPDILEEIEIIKTESDLEAFYTKQMSSIPGTVNIVDSYQEHIKKREISDFVVHYNNRFKALSNILKSRDLDNLTAIRRIQEMKKEDVSAIGMVYEIGITKNGHMMIDIEDKTGIIRVLVSKDKTDLFKIAENLVHDEVIALVGRTGDNSSDNAIIFANDILFPDVPHDATLKCAPYEGKMLILSDIHLGTEAFYEKEFQKLIAWIKKQSDIKYLIIAGDLVEGVGIFPGQEDELTILSVKEQYKAFTDYIKTLDKNIKIIMCPGNHDALRLAEPQPPFNPTFSPSLFELPNVTLVSSPGIVNIGKTENFEGFNLLLYHGFSMPYYGDKIPYIREAGGLSRMDLILEYYLQKRHFAPTHGSTQFIPDIRKDSLVIEKVPDFLITGHIHKILVKNYRGITLVNASGWMKATEYQKRFGLMPDPCKAILVDLKTRAVTITDFLEDNKDDSSK